MGWDCTGEEGVYYWAQYFGDIETVDKTIRTIQGYDPVVAHWAYNGNARRYWDFQFGGKYDRMERQIHHYGSALNALPLLQHIRTRPQEASPHLLRLAFGGHFAPISNIQEDGFASAAMHSWADMLSWDEFSGDYGPAFAGLVLGSACYVMDDEEFGLTAFYGRLAPLQDGSYKVHPRDALRRRMYVGPLDAFVEFDAGAITCATIDGQSIIIELEASATEGAAPAEEAVLWFNQTFRVEGAAEGFEVAGDRIERKRGGWAVRFQDGKAEVQLTRAV